MQTGTSMNFLNKRNIIKSLIILAVVTIHLEMILRFHNLNIYVFGVLLILIFILKTWNVAHFALLFLILFLNKYLIVGFLRELPSVSFLIPFFISTAVIILFPPTRHLMLWFRKGTIDKISILLIFITGLVSAGALIAWARWTDNLGLSIEMMRNFVQYPPWLLFIFGIPVFAFINAFSEEAVYRGVLQEALIRTEFHKVLILFLQASAFAAAHFLFGFPNGYWGYAMVFLYGIMLGYLRSRTKGILAPYFAHCVADFTIGYFVFSHVVN